MPAVMARMIKPVARVCHAMVQLSHSGAVRRPVFVGKCPAHMTSSILARPLLKPEHPAINADCPVHDKGAVLLLLVFTSRGSKAPFCLRKQEVGR
ncbi:hypothetical protein D3C78_1343930 [compost metagenome]